MAKTQSPEIIRERTGNTVRSLIANHNRVFRGGEKLFLPPLTKPLRSLDGVTLTALSTARNDSLAFGADERIGAKQKHLTDITLVKSLPFSPNYQNNGRHTHQRLCSIFAGSRISGQIMALYLQREDSNVSDEREARASAVTSGVVLSPNRIDAFKTDENGAITAESGIDTASWINSFLTTQVDLLRVTSAPEIDGVFTLPGEVISSALSRAVAALRSKPADIPQHES